MKHRGLIDLHLHLDGSLSVSTVRELAAAQNIDVPADDRELLKKLQVGPDCRDLNEYLEKFAFPCSLMQTPAAITATVRNLCRELADQGLIYAEIRFAPQFHTLKGLTQAQVVEAAVAGLDADVLPAGLILCCMRGDKNHAENLETVAVAEQFLGKGVCAVDLAGAEALFPTKNFGDLFALAKEKNIPYTIHAGEADGPESVWKALEYGTKRLGHGVRSLEDPALVRHLVENGITLEMCPTSNLNTCMFERIEDYPLLKLMDAGVAVTINTDNMTVSAVTLGSETDLLAKTFGLTDEHFKAIASNAARASFASSELKEELLEKIAAM